MDGYKNQGKSGKNGERGRGGGEGERRARKGEEGRARKGREGEGEGEEAERGERAFIYFPSGLVHVSHLSKARVERPEDVVDVGERVWVKVIGVTVCLFLLSFPLLLSSSSLPSSSFLLLDCLLITFNLLRKIEKSNYLSNL